MGEGEWRDVSAGNKGEEIKSLISSEFLAIQKLIEEHSSMFLAPGSVSLFHGSSQR